jgi:hypothetical protein
MEEVIDRNINSDEILVRCFFKGDFKRNKTFVRENIIEKDVFIDTRPNVDVSLLRKRYYSIDNCIIRGKNIKSDLVGFLTFKKIIFDNVVEKHKNNISKEFDAEIISTPLDEFKQIIPINIKVTTSTPINPGHADLRYINPGLIYSDENPNIALRRFSRTLFQECEIIII